MATEDKQAERLKARIIRNYSAFVKKNGRLPALSELTSLGTTRHQIRHWFGTLEGLREEIRKGDPKLFAGLINESVFNEKAMAALEKRVDRTNVAIVSTAVAGAKVHRGFQSALEAYTKKRKGTLLYIPVADPACVGGFQLDPELDLNRMVYSDIKLNDHMYVSTIKLSAKQVDPTTGLDRMGHKRSFVFGSPKQRLVVKPNAQGMHPHVFMGTGAVTRPNYKTDRYMSERLASLAEIDHVMGALVVETSEDYYHFRQLQANARGDFVDLGKMYKTTGEVIDYAPDFFVLGDLHVGDTDPVALKCWLDVLKRTGAKNLVLHDAINGHSISHHVEGRIIEKAVEALKGRTSLEQEGRDVAACFSNLLKHLPKEGKLYIVASNHNDFIYRYLNDRRFVNDHENLAFVARELLTPTLRGEDPARVLVELFLSEADKKRIVWWSEDEDFRYAGVLLSAHGDRGPNGSKGTIKNHAQAYGPCIVGHSHTPGIFREAYQVGTTTFHKLSYARGPSSWMQTSCLLYRNGARQLINCIEGKYAL